MVTTGRIWAGICSAGLCVAPAQGAAQSDATSDYELSQVGASTAAGAASQAEKPVARSLDDTTFVSAAWQAGVMIVSAAEIAVTHTTDSGIRQVAQVVKIEQSAANGQLAELARHASIRYDAAPAATLNTTLDKMRTTIGIGFDEAYLQEAITEQKRLRQGETLDRYFSRAFLG